ncbi:MAG: hypothetical protein AB7L13_16945 [Acidimicrobiia bacterium]
MANEVTPPTEVWRWLVASTAIGAGLIHAAALGPHADHSAVLAMFTVVAVVQIALGVAVAKGAPGRPVHSAVALLGAGASLAVIAGWAFSRTIGIGFVSGLDAPEHVGLADLTASVMELITAGGLLVLWRARHPGSTAPSARSFAGLSSLMVVAVGAMGVPAVVSAAREVHHDGASHTHDGAAVASTSLDGHSHDSSATGVAATTAVAVPFDPSKPVDLGGVPGVTPDEQKRAEKLLSETLAVLPRWADVSVAQSEGWVSIGDGRTGTEHFINVKLMADGRILDARYPESLVYAVAADGSRTLEAAMYMLEPGATLETAPNIGGLLTQWHVHDNLCFSAGANPRIVGLSSNGECRVGVKGGSVPMIHVWIKPNKCGPFASLEGIGAGQIRDGESRLCDTAHGS